MADLMTARRRILLNTPHVETASGSIASFQTDMVGKLKECRIYFAPVQEGAGDPSPDNVRPITGWTGCKITRCGKNLLNSSKVIPISSGWELTEMGMYLPTLKYSISSQKGINKGFAVRVYDKAGNQAFVAYPYANPFAYLITNKYISQVTIGFNNDGHTRADWESAEIQLELGNTATDYEPYQGTTIPIDWTDEAGTVYGGYVDLVQGEVVATKAAVTFNGSQNIGLNNWRGNSGSVAWLYSRHILPGIKLESVAEMHKITVMCDTMTPIDYSAMYTSATITSVSGVSGGNWSIAMRVADTSLTTVAAKNAWLQDHPATVVYNLATPIHYPIDPITLKTLSGTNNIFSDLNGNVAVKYWKH